MIVAVLVMVILTLLGVSFLLIAETENRIAENERLSAQALYFSEAGARAVVQWFNHPGSSGNLANPPIGVLDRTLREIDDDGDGEGGTPTHLQDGSTWPRYKQDVDRNGDGLDDVFDRPYRRELKNTFLGTEAGPDIRIDGSAAGAARTFLDAFSEALLGGYPGGATGVHARIRRIDVYGPPYVEIGGEWTRYGVATVKVVGRIVRTDPEAEVVLAERWVKVVLNEIPYATPFGALHSCGDLDMSGPITASWGAVTAVGDVRLDGDHTHRPASFPRVPPPGARVDLLWGDATRFGDYRSQVDHLPVEDPWLRILAGGDLREPGHVVPGVPQPNPFPWTDGQTSLGAGQHPSHAGPGLETHSNLFQTMTLVGCPELDYQLWKAIATSGQDGIEYYAWDGSAFRRDGVGAPGSFQVLSDDDPADPDARPRILFFDTTDGVAPHDDDGDGTYDNLTPLPIVIAGTWSSRA